MKENKSVVIKQKKEAVLTAASFVNSIFVIFYGFVTVFLSRTTEV